MNSFNPKRLKWRTICDTAVLHQADTWGGESRLTKLTLGKGGIMTRTFTCATSSGKIRAVKKKVLCVKENERTRVWLVSALFYFRSNHHILAILPDQSFEHCMSSIILFTCQNFY